jgi:hypothetical protein
VCWFTYPRQEIQAFKLGIRYSCIEMNLAQALSASLAADQNIRTAAEAQLIEWRNQDSDIVIQLLDIVSNEGESNAVRQAASLLVKNSVLDKWGSKPEFQEERSKLRLRIVQTMLLAPPQSLSGLSTAVALLINVDPFPYSWPDLIPTIDRLLTSGDSSAHSVLVGLTVLIEVLRHYRWVLGGTAGLEQVTQMFFPRLLQIGRTMAAVDKTDNGEAGDILWKVLKAYKIAIEGELPPYLQQQQQVEEWVSLFLIVLTKAPSLPTARGWEKCYKWAILNINKLFLWYAVIPADDEYLSAARLHLSEIYAPFSDLFISHFAPEITRQLVAILRTLADTPLSEASLAVSTLIREIFLYLEKCVRVDALWPVVLGELELLLSKCVFKTLLLTEDDLSMLEYEPEQYIYTQFTEVARYEPIGLTAQIATRMFVSTLGAKRADETLNGIVYFANSTLADENSDPGMELNRDCAMQILAAVSPSVSLHKEDVIELFVKNYVLMDLKSKRAFLRARACNLVIHYVSDRSLSAETLQKVYGAVLSCSRDSSIVVKAEAILALRELLQIEGIRATHAEHVNETIQRILELYTSDVGAETLSPVLDDLVMMYSDKLVPLANSLTHEMAGQFHHIFQELQECGESDYAAMDDKISAAQSILGTIRNVLTSLEDYPDGLNGVEQDISGILNSIFDKAEISLYPEAIDILDCLLTPNRSVTFTLWAILDQLRALFTSDPETCVDELIPSLDRFLEMSTISKCTDMWTTERLQFLNHVVLFALTSPVQPVTKKNAACLAQRMLLSLQVDSLDVHDLVKAAIHFQEYQQCFNIILAFFCTNAARTMYLLREEVASDAILEKLIVRYVAPTDYERKLCSLAIFRLLTLSENELSSDHIIHLCKKFLDIISPPPTTGGTSQPQFRFVSEYNAIEFSEDSEPVPTLDSILTNVFPEMLYAEGMAHISKRTDVSSKLPEILSEHEETTHRTIMGKS